jgi:CheY-like chemotaxis protein
MNMVTILMVEDDAAVRLLMRAKLKDKFEKIGRRLVTVKRA